MRKTIYILSCLFLICLYGNAQSNSSIIDDLSQTKSGQGKIAIYQDDAIKNLVGKSITRNTPNDDLILAQLDNNSQSPKSFIRTRGYRIQVYSGNNQRRSKNEAESRRDAIQSSFPNMEVNVSYNSPVWRVKAGNFRTEEQANTALNELRNQFPSFGREMYVVSDAVKLPIE